MTVWWFISPKIIFGEDAIEELGEFSSGNAFIVTDPVVYKLGLTEKLTQLLTARGWSVALWDCAEPDPTVSIVKQAASAMDTFCADMIIAIGGGSVMDTAKAAWILYEHPDIDLEAVNPLEPLHLRQKARMICIPTTAGTGSEATRAIVIRDDETGRKFSTSNGELAPDYAILDPQFVKGLPKDLTAYTGLDALSHAVEGYTSLWKNDFSDGCSLKAVRLIFEWLPHSYNNPDDLEAREKMLIAANLGGLSFSNSQVALVHSFGHSIGSVLKLHHGMSVGMVLPYVIEFNIKGNEDSAKLYQELAQQIGISESDSTKASIEFANRIRALQDKIHAPKSLKAAGISKKDFENGLDELIEFTMMDASITMNARDISQEEVKKLYTYLFEGKSVDF
ncbi:MAG: iron-containing alcohol dehydrogenase [Candidatus Lokiarchaeota archaeon]|nr:iron-containing alcohol dehydrogenase [Candidatus Lokiarchaeota archaeon]